MTNPSSNAQPVSAIVEEVAKGDEDIVWMSKPA